MFAGPSPAEKEEATLEKWKDALDRGVLAVSAKTEAMVESGRIRSALAGVRRDMDMAVSDLGFQYYNGWLSGAWDEAALSASCEHIQELHSEVLALQSRLERVQAGRQGQSSSLFCSACGKKLIPGSRFCDGCGAPAGR